MAFSICLPVLSDGLRFGAEIDTTSSFQTGKTGLQGRSLSVYDGHVGRETDRIKKMKGDNHNEKVTVCTDDHRDPDDDHDNYSAGCIC